VKRRKFMSILGGAAVTWPVAARAQQPVRPLVAFIQGGSAEANIRNVAAIRKGLAETGYVEGENVAVEYHWLAGRYDHLPALIDGLIRRRVAVIATNGNVPSLAVKAATATIPIVFGVAGDPVRLGLVASLARPGGNATGINFFSQEVVAKRLRLLHDLVPAAVHIAVLVNPANASTTDAALREVREAAGAVALQVRVVEATTIAEIDGAFANFARERPDALFVAPDGFFASRGVQFSVLAARDRLPAAYSGRETTAVGGLMSYGADIPALNHRLGVYAGRILKGTKAADMPVMQSTKFEFVINLITARALGIDVSPALLAIADEVIE
jgi:putative tryptophan/tyrosine transport system substrate-binding protein